MSVKMLHAGRKMINVVPQILGTASPTCIEEPKVSVDHPAVTCGSKRWVPQSGDGLAVCQKRDKGEKGVKAGKSCCSLISKEPS
jgi:hypothetical protein